MPPQQVRKPKEESAAVQRSSIRESIVESEEWVEDVVSTVRNDDDRVLLLKRDEQNRAFAAFDRSWQGCVQVDGDEEWETSGHREWTEDGFWGAVGWCLEGETGTVDVLPKVITPLADD